MRERKGLIKEIQEISFALVELNLFLDNHPTDTRALADFRRLSRELKNAKEKYESQYGPLLNFGYGENQSTTYWQWVDEPWPWEM
ncbi:MAG: spore coat protein CotJB [Clostridia bacterium]|jgi:spore coat protein JB|nr:spore coat protein CotJB [Clostridia bacterium]